MILYAILACSPRYGRSAIDVEAGMCMEVTSGEHHVAFLQCFDGATSCLEETSAINLGLYPFPCSHQLLLPDVLSSIEYLII